MGSEEGILRVVVVESPRSKRERGAHVVVRVTVDNLAHTKPEADTEAGILRSIFSRCLNQVHCIFVFEISELLYTSN